MSIVITGATGQLGRLVIAELLTSGVPAGQIKAVARSREKAKDLAAQGIVVVLADYDHPESFTDVFQPGDRALLISGTDEGRRAPQHATVIDAARIARVDQLAYTSVLGGPRADFGLADDHRATEDLIVASKVPYTLLRNGWYSEAYASDQGAFSGVLAAALERGTVISSTPGSARLATAARADYAAAAATVLTQRGHLHAAYELSGDTAWSFDEFAAEITRLSGRKVVHQQITPEELHTFLRAAGLSGTYADTLVDVDRAITRGRLGLTSGDLARLLGRPTTPIAASISAGLDV